MYRNKYARRKKIHPKFLTTLRHISRKQTTEWRKGRNSKQSLQSEKLSVQQFVNNGKESHLRRRKNYDDNNMFSSFFRIKKEREKHVGTVGCVM